MRHEELIILKLKQDYARQKVNKWLQVVRSNLSKEKNITLEAVKELFHQLDYYEEELGEDGKNEEIGQMVERLQNQQDQITNIPTIAAVNTITVTSAAATTTVITGDETEIVH